MTVEDLYAPHESRPWNPTIASVFHKCGIIESWGRGTLKVAELIARAGLRRPESEELTDTLLVRFRTDRYVPSKRIGHDLLPRQRQVLAALSKAGPAGLKEIEAALGLDTTRRSLQRDLQFLRSLKLVDGSGVGRGAKWWLQDERAS